MEYFKLSGLNQRTLSELLGGSPNERMISRYTTGATKMPADFIWRVYLATDKQVGLEDWAYLWRDDIKPRAAQNRSQAAA